MNDNNSINPEEPSITSENLSTTPLSQGESEVLPNKIVVTIEDGKMVFKKPQESLDEILFYNTDYFTQIGFPDAEVSVGEMSPDGTMKGGRYKDVNKLTLPFRHFAFFLQSDRNDNASPANNTSAFYPFNNNNNTNNADKDETKPPGFFERFGKYNSDASNYLKTSMLKLGPYFKQRPTQITPTNANDKSISPDLGITFDGKSSPVIHQMPTERTPEEHNPESRPTQITATNANDTSITPDSPKEQEPEPEPEPHMPQKYWIVKIPIVEDKEVVPKGKYEKAEDKLLVYALVKKKDERMLLSNSNSNSNSKSKVGVMYEVGSRYLILCERVIPIIDGNPSSPENHRTSLTESPALFPIEGSLMQKMSGSPP